MFVRSSEAGGLPSLPRHRLFVEFMLPHPRYLLQVPASPCHCNHLPVLKPIWEAQSARYSLARRYCSGLEQALGVGGRFWTLGVWALWPTPVFGVDNGCRRGARVCATAASVARPSSALVKAPYTERTAP